MTFAGEDLLGYEGSVCTIVESETDGDRVFVALYDVHEKDEQLLDEVEGAIAGTYQKLHLRAVTLDGEQTAWVYVFAGYEGGLPTAWYLSELAGAARKAGHPTTTWNSCAPGPPGPPPPDRPRGYRARTSRS